MIRARFGVAFFGLILAVAPLAFVSQPAEAAGAICNGSKASETQSQVVVLGGCTTSTGTGGRQANPIYQTIKRYENQPCKDANGHDSVMGVIWDPILQSSYDWCLLQRGGPGVVDTTQLAINAPKPTADFADRFLTGAEAKFSVPEMTSHAQSLRQFPGATINATPTKMAWDFGDGTKSSELEPKHIFLTTTPDPNKPNDHTVHVRVTGTWHLYLHPADQGVNNPVQDLGEVSLTGQLDRPIVEVWSAQTEPKQNA